MSNVLLSAEQIAASNARHHDDRAFPGWCNGCSERWPCEATALLAHVEARDKYFSESVNELASRDRIISALRKHGVEQAETIERLRAALKEASRLLHEGESIDAVYCVDDALAAVRDVLGIITKLTDAGTIAKLRGALERIEKRGDQISPDYHIAKDALAAVRDESQPEKVKL